MSEVLTKDFRENYSARKPLFWGLAAGVALLSVYFLILTIANSFRHSLEQLQGIWYWIMLLVLGFGTQVGLYVYMREAIRLRKNSGAATSAVAAAGGISTTSMIACCAHHVTDVVPVLGASAAAVFLTQYQNIFIILGVLSNLIGITVMLNIIQKNDLYHEGNGLLSSLMRIDMQKSLYVVGSFSLIAFLLTIYISV